MTDCIISRVIFLPAAVQFVSNATCLGSCGQLSRLLPQTNNINAIQKNNVDVPEVAQKQDMMLVVGVQAVMGFPTDD